MLRVVMPGHGPAKLLQIRLNAGNCSTNYSHFLRRRQPLLDEALPFTVEGGPLVVAEKHEDWLHEKDEQAPEGILLSTSI